MRHQDWRKDGRRPVAMARGLVALVMVGCAAMAGPASAASNDHLRCDRVSDTVEAGGAVDLATVPFGVDAGCTVEGVAREICSPVGADVVAAAEGEPAVAGLDSVQERICYRLRCPEKTRPTAQVRDRFGARTVTVKRPATVCVPVSR